jgi:hypothetical protein
MGHNSLALGDDRPIDALPALSPYYFHLSHDFLNKLAFAGELVYNRSLPA